MLTRFIYPKPVWIFVMLLLSGISLATLYSYHVQIRILWVITIAVLIWSFITGLLLLYWLLKCIGAKENKNLVDLLDKKTIMLSGTVVLNVVFFVYYFFIWLAFRSMWFGTMVVFYSTLVFGRALLAVETRYGASRLQTQWKKYIMCGYLILVMATIMLIQTFLISRGNYSIVYPGNTLWIVFGINVYLTVYAIRGWLNYKEWNCPLLTADRILALSACFLGLYSILIAFVDRFKVLGINTLGLSMIGYTAMGALIIIACYMIIHGSYRHAETPVDSWL